MQLPSRAATSLLVFSTANLRRRGRITEFRSVDTTYDVHRQVKLPAPIGFAAIKAVLVHLYCRLGKSLVQDHSTQQCHDLMARCICDPIATAVRRIAYACMLYEPRGPWH